MQNQFDELRRRAEQLLQQRQAGQPDPELIEVQDLLHELAVHQTELELQNQDLRQAQQALAESRDRYAELYDAAPVGYLTLNPQGIVQEANRTLLNMLDVPRESCTGAPFSRFVRPCSRDLYYEFLNRLLRAGASPPCDLALYQPQQEDFHVRLDGSVMRDEQDSITQLHITVNDVTARVRAERASQQYAAELERSNQDLKRYADLLSHDLRQPIRTVTGFLNLLERRYGDQLGREGVELLHYAVDGARRLGEMIQGLLDLSQVTTRVQPFVPVDLGLLVQEVLDLLQIVIEEQGAQITCDSLPVVVGDGRQLRQVFQNLLENGIKFQPPGATPQVHVAAQRRNHEWLFSVKDNGIGLDPGEAERVFSIFQRLYTQEEYPGLGIGLAVCQKIIQRHGGRIWVESQPGAGATFYFTLPATG